MNEPLDAYLRVYGISVTWSRSVDPLRVIFDDAFGTAQDGQYEVETRTITAQAKTASITGMAKGDAITARGKVYVVDRVRPDSLNPDWSVIYLDINE